PQRRRSGVPPRARPRPFGAPGASLHPLSRGEPMTLRKTLAIVPALFVLLVGLAHAQTSYTTTSDVRIQMDDGVTLDSDEEVPDWGCPCRGILGGARYGRSGGGVGEANVVFPANGYAEVVVDVRGTGSSEGVWDSFGPREQADSAALVQWAASRSFSNGVVGL